MTRFTLACAAALTLAAAPVFAQSARQDAASADPKSAQPAPGSDEWLRLRGESYRAAPDSEQTPEELAATSKLNASVAASAEAAERADADAQAAFEAESERWRAEASRASTAQAQWEADVAAAEAARVQWERDQARWEREVAACRASNRTCIVPPAPVAPK
jgi:hypothetical protein